MLHLTLTGLSEDNRRLVLVSDAGDQFSLVIDAKLRAALRGEHGRLGQLEIQMDSALRPRDIQARIRAGESPDDVAQAAQTTVDKILPYASPVLDERAHVAARAQRSSVRRPSGGEVGGARTLGESVTAMLRRLNVDPGTVEWDAWRREDGRWSLVGQYATPERNGTGTFTFDAPGNYVTVDNDDAKWLVGDGVATGASTPKDDLQQARKRRLHSVPEDELPLGADAIDLVSEDKAPAGADGRSDGVADTRSDTDLSPTPEPLAHEPVAHEQAGRAAAGGDVASEPASRRPARKKGRASVPSWDEIMFGGAKHD